MTDEFETVSEDELHAYVDGQLSPPERERIASWLERHPARAEEVRQWQAQAAALKQNFASYARSGENDRALVRARRSAGSTGLASPAPTLRRLAAGFLIFAAGALAGAYARDLIVPQSQLAAAASRLSPAGAVGFPDLCQRSAPPRGGRRRRAGSSRHMARQASRLRAENPRSFVARLLARRRTAHPGQWQGRRDADV